MYKMEVFAMDTPQADPITTETRQRLLEAAGEVFAERGFRATTVRDICRRARANLAAVNYYFGDKEQLYAAVLQSTFHCASEKYPLDLGLGAEATAEERLQAFIRSHLFSLLDEGLPAWHRKLITREMAEPTGALDALVDQMIRPEADLLMSIVRDVLGHDATPRRVWRCAASIIGQCLFYHHARPVIKRLDPEQTYTPEAIEQLVDHVTQFSLAALRQFARAQPGEAG
jgi:TetR/AcrR family transcriptional regulator, regulator of cefoperazone and chloramphenicol sensitivity